MKQPQLHHRNLASRRPTPNRNGFQAETTEEIGAKVHTHIACSWAYLAGFSDAESSISICPRSPKIRLEIGQKHKAVLDNIHKLLVKEVPRFANRVRPAG
ncbi:unnamed protein product [Polarella glacialis]|uniref:Uncharacterized protein n=1 Tax=Polarella glacialis TaxID=89957 RepID=A0A813EUY3_POLGL|nr:unnamed protein product [Polarella glacialis]